MYPRLILILLWTAWCVLHSLLISQSVTERMKKLLSYRYGYYRLAYNIFSLVSLIPVVYFQLHLEETVIFAWPRPWIFLKIGMYAASFLLFYGGFRVYDIQYLLGIKQIQGIIDGSSQNSMKFSTGGILAYVRHPWYSGAILCVWAFDDVTDISLISKIVLTMYIIIGTRLEEKKLITEIGEPYLDYRKKVPMLIPWKKI